MNIPWKALLLAGAAGALSITFMPVRACCPGPGEQHRAVLEAGNVPLPNPDSAPDGALEDSSEEDRDILIEVGEGLPMTPGEHCLTLAMGDPSGKGRRTKRVVIRTDGEDRPRLGVVLRFEKSTKTDSKGAYIQAVTPGGPADEAGVKVGDIITKFDGQPLAGPYSKADGEEALPAARLRDLAGKMEDGQKVSLEILRGEKPLTLEVVARKLDGRNDFQWNGEWPDADIEKYIQGDLPAFDFAFCGGGWLDMELVSLNPDLGEYFGAAEGVLVVTPPEDSLGIKAGDVIQKIGDRKVSSPSQAFRILNSYDAGDTMTLDLVRKQRPQTLQVKVPDAPESQGKRTRIIEKRIPAPSSPVRAPAGTRRG